MSGDKPGRAGGGPDAGNARGIACPRCGSADVRVRHTRRDVAAVRRYRKCGDCGRTFGTVERVAGGPPGSSTGTFSPDLDEVVRSVLAVLAERGILGDNRP